MYRFSLHKSNGANSLEEEYKSIFSSKILVTKAKKWDAIKVAYPCLSFVSNMAYDAILVAPFDRLVEIYYQYIHMNITEELREDIDERIKECFPYKSQSIKIMEFFESHTEHTRATTCPYCDCHEINVYPQQGLNRDYHLDHYLDKGVCPIVAISLHNLVPVCSSCNTTKGAQTFGGDAIVSKLLSPWNPNYDFDSKACFKITPKGGDTFSIQTEDFCKKVKVDIEFEDAQYKNETDVTKIMRRIYANKKTLSNKELVDYLFFVLSVKQKLSLYDASFVAWANRYMQTSTEEERQNGIRIRYDKFKRDISNM